MPPRVEFKHISKSFPGVKALTDISLTLEPGEVHVLVGENGAGKSTLMKILSGAYTADEGELWIEGKQVEKNSPTVASDLGIGMIYQELNLIPELSIARNIFMCNEIKGKLKVFNSSRAMNAEARRLMREINLEEEPTTLVKNISVGSQQMVEIIKAISKQCKVLVFDEPTSSLTAAEIEKLFAMIRKLKEQGVGMFYISHRLEELYEIGDRVSIMRDGCLIGTHSIRELRMEQMIEQIAGRKIENLYPHTRKTPGRNVLEVSHLEGDDFHDISLHVRAGEIVGLSGLMGAGRTELVQAIMGIDRYHAGCVLINEKPLKKNSVKKAITLGAGLLPENRKQQGLALSLSIRENAVISSLEKLNKHGIVNVKRERSAAEKYRKELAMATPSVEKVTNYLSGGTQQKVVIAKWLLADLELFIFDEPTRGIDVGAKSEIYRLMDELVERGAAILMISSDLPEILGMSDRIYVMAQGRLTGELDISEADQNKVLTLAYQMKQEGRK